MSHSTQLLVGSIRGGGHPKVRKAKRATGLNPISQDPPKIREGCNWSATLAALQTGKGTGELIITGHK